MINFSRGKKNLAGQHAIEYVILLTLIMAGIITMSPYVIRSWNANLKGWEDSAVDSIEDPFIPATPVAITGCDSNGWVPQGCGLGIAQDCTGDIMSCSPVEMLETRSFSPSGCQCAVLPAPLDTARCTVDPCCCTLPVGLGICGANVTQAPNPEPVCNAQMTAQNPDNTCPDGMELSWVLCGNDVDPADRRYGCMPNPTLCDYNCTGVPATGPGFLSLCPGDDTGLFGNTAYTYTDSCTPAKCEILCDNPNNYYSSPW